MQLLDTKVGGRVKWSSFTTNQIRSLHFWPIKFGHFDPIVLIRSGDHKSIQCHLQLAVLKYEIYENKGHFIHIWAVYQSHVVPSPNESNLYEALIAYQDLIAHHWYLDMLWLLRAVCPYVLRNWLIKVPPPSCPINEGRKPVTMVMTNVCGREGNLLPWQWPLHVGGKKTCYHGDDYRLF